MILILFIIPLILLKSSVKSRFSAFSLEFNFKKYYTVFTVVSVVEYVIHEANIMKRKILFVLPLVLLFCILSLTSSAAPPSLELKEFSPQISHYMMRPSGDYKSQNEWNYSSGMDSGNPSGCIPLPNASGSLQAEPLN